MRIAAALMATLLLVGCAGIRKERGHDQVAALVKERAGVSTGWEGGTPEADQIAARVDALLADGLTSDRAVAIALINNPALQATYEELGISQAELVQAGLLSNPTLDLSIGLPLSGSSGIAEHEAGIVQGFLELFMLPLRKKIAEEQFFAATRRVAHEVLSHAAEVRKDVLELQLLQQQLALQQQVLTAAQAAGELAVAQHRAGNITQLELATRRADAEQTRIDLARAELAVLSARERLNRQLGLWGPRTSWTLKERLAELPAEESTPERLESLAIRQRLDVAAARTEAALMRRAVSLARSWRWFGSVEVGVHEHQDADGPHLIGPTLTLELPLFDQRQAEIARLEAQQRQSERRLASLAIHTRSEVRETSARLIAARQLVLHLRDTLMPLREQAVEHAQLQYNGMQLGLYELLEARREQIGTYRDYLEALRDYWGLRIELERVVGGRLSKDLPQRRDER